MGQNVTVRDANGAIEKPTTSAFQRRHPRLKPIRIDPFPGHVLNFKKRHNIMATTLLHTHVHDVREGAQVAKGAADRPARHRPARVLPGVAQAGIREGGVHDLRRSSNAMK